MLEIPVFTSLQTDVSPQIPKKSARLSAFEADVMRFSHYTFLVHLFNRNGFRVVSIRVHNGEFKYTDVYNV